MGRTLRALADGTSRGKISGKCIETWLHGASTEAETEAENKEDFNEGPQCFRGYERDLRLLVSRRCPFAIHA